MRPRRTALPRTAQKPPSAAQAATAGQEIVALAQATYATPWTTPPCSGSCSTDLALPARTTALVALAAELPPPVLAELPDVHIHTALKWTHHAQRDGSA
jgi:hypothetical protein